MVVDASVLIQILFAEEGTDEAVAVLDRTADLMMAAPSLLEAEIVYGSRRGFQARDVIDLVDRLGIAIRPFTAEHAREARLAYARFGKGQGHAARLNFGDCISYALATVEGVRLAYKGGDFGLTDIPGVRLG